jgi:hypothetical protein
LLVNYTRTSYNSQQPEPSPISLGAITIANVKGAVSTTVVPGDHFPAIVLDQRRDFYLQYGLSRYSAIQRASVAAD